MIDSIVSILQTAFSFPTVVLTVGVLLVLTYWLFSAMTGIGGEVDGAVDGAVEGLLEGVAEGAAEGLLEGLTDGAAEGVAEGLAGGAGEGSFAWQGLGRLFGCLGLTAVPITIFGSMVVLFSWGLSLLLSRLLGTHIGLKPTSLVVGAGILILALGLGVLATALVLRPLRPLFRSPAPLRRRDLVGRTVTLRSQRVDADLGQAEYDDGQAGILLDVRCTAGNSLRRGDQVRIARFDAAADLFYLEAHPVADPAPPAPASGAQPGSNDHDLSTENQAQRTPAQRTPAQRTPAPRTPAPKTPAQ